MCEKEDGLKCWPAKDPARIPLLFSRPGEKIKLTMIVLPLPAAPAAASGRLDVRA